MKNSEIRNEIIEKIARPAEAHGMSDNKINKIAEEIAKKYHVTALEVIEMLWDMPLGI